MGKKYEIELGEEWEINVKIEYKWEGICNRKI